ncbi:MAG TPA: cyclopropane-fatty-acyl-phospholipid synthase family protein [Burkholderiales bacterium]|nr:cyclopropane-fatty-acyl-phospholipid synthase family protein [Burkholderiales bacterium]
MKDQKTATLTLPSANAGDERYGATPRQAVSAIDRRLARKMLEAAGRPAIALVLWNGEEIYDGSVPLMARAHISDRFAFFRLLRNPSLHFGDLYSAARIQIEGDLVDFLVATYRGMSDQQRGVLARLHKLVTPRPRANTLRGSRANIHHHYDIGNPFYELWLDRDYQQYTCAYFPDPTLTLEQAQAAKLEHVCRKLELKPGDSVAEAGCGWGGLARYMAKHHGVRVRAYNISHEQVAYARSRARAEGLTDRVEYVEDDYRNIAGEYDKFVSIGMLEHVGPGNYAGLGDVIHRVLKPNGRGLIHTIGRNKPELMNAWIEKRIFPGAYPPTLREMMEIFEPYGFSVLDVENLRLHYAETLRHWLKRYEENVSSVETMFDRTFVRAWRLYLAGSIAAFLSGSLQLFQIVFARPLDNSLPFSRAHLYK